MATAFLLGSGGCFDALNEHGVCTTDDCGGDYFRVLGKLEDPLPEHFTVDVCSEHSCSPFALDRPQPGDGVQRETPGLRFTLLAEPEDAFTIDAVFLKTGQQPKNGETYRIKIVDDSGTSLFDRTWTAAYRKVSADDGFCDDENDVYCIQSDARF